MCAAKPFILSWSTTDFAFACSLNRPSSWRTIFSVESDDEPDVFFETDVCAASAEESAGTADPVRGAKYQNGAGISWTEPFMIADSRLSGNSFLIRSANALSPVSCHSVRRTAGRTDFIDGRSAKVFSNATGSTVSSFFSARQSALHCSYNFTYAEIASSEDPRTAELRYLSAVSQSPAERAQRTASITSCSELRFGIPAASPAAIPAAAAYEAPASAYRPSCS